MSNHSLILQKVFIKQYEFVAIFLFSITIIIFILTTTTAAINTVIIIRKSVIMKYKNPLNSLKIDFDLISMVISNMKINVIINLIISFLMNMIIIINVINYIII